MAVIPEFYINAVTSIGSRTDTGVSWFGTGFFILRIIDAEGNEVLCQILFTYHSDEFNSNCSCSIS